MSEELLKAIIQLLAIVAKEDQVTDDERETIEIFLSQNLSKEDTAKYLQLFDKLTAGVPNSPDDNIDEKAEIINITKNVNQEFTTQQKVVVMLVLMQLIMADGVITEREDELLFFIGDAFNVPKDEIEQIKSYVVHSDKANLSSPNILIIDNGENDKPFKSKHYVSKHLDGFVAILRIKSAEIYFMKYIGTSALTLNGIALKRNQNISILSQGSAIRGTKIKPMYFSDIISSFREEARETSLSFVAEKVHFKFKNGGIGLRNINIAESGGKLIGLMGGSGAGKSTLLNVLNGNETPSEGSVRINGKDIHKEKDELEGVIGYVPQDDLLMDDLTVYQNLYFATKLCFSSLDDEGIDKLVNQTLASLGLSETRDLRVGSPLDKTISGGQRKRLNIGLELLREPAVLFVDEPTSGLSSRDSENIMDLLKELSLKGKMIFVVIHQPSSDIYKMFDKMVILDLGGYQIYYGNPVDAVTYFKTIVNMIDREVGSCIECGNVNPEQIFNIIETKVVNEYGKFTDQRKISPETWYEYFQKKIKIREVKEFEEKPKATLDIPNKIKQAVIFTLRDVKSKLSNKQYLVINLAEAPVLALLLAYIVRYYPSDESQYWFGLNENIPAFFFMSVIVALFMGLTVSAEEIIKDRKILKRESFLNLSRLSYLFSKMLILFTLSAIQTLMFVLIGDLVLGIESMTITYWIILFSVSCFANTLGLNVSSAFNSAVTIYILIPLLLIPQLILSGVVVNFDKLNPQITSEDKVPFIGEMMASRWAFEALMVTSFKDNPYEEKVFEIDKAMANNEYLTTYYIPRLEIDLDYAHQNYTSSDDEIQNEVNERLMVVKNEIEKQLAHVGRDKFPEADQITTNFNSEVFNKAKEFLATLRKVYANRYNDASKQRDVLIASLNPEEKESFETAQKKWANEQIKFLVRNSAAEKRVIETEGHLVRKIYPVYMDPQPTSPIDFREQFYFSQKHFLGVNYDTKVFNVIMIWFMTVTLMITLYFDVFRKVIDGFSFKGKK
ncbi:MAG: ATP-binding cassette domain-containing protein [Cyclobacteriaceae bacterium]